MNRETLTVHYHPLLKVGGELDQPKYDLVGLEVFLRSQKSQDVFPTSYYLTEMQKDAGLQLVALTLWRIVADLELHPWLQNQKLHVNLSPEQITPELVHLFRQNADLHTILAIEVLEDSALSIAQIDRVLQLHELGFQIWIDDLPEKFSFVNLAALQDIIAGVKIAKPTMSLQELQAVAHHLSEVKKTKPHLGIVVEQIATENDLRRVWHYLQIFGIAAQGYLFSLPNRPEAIKDKLDGLDLRQ